MLNASVSVERVFGRLRRPQEPRSTSATTLQVRSLAIADRLRRGAWSAAVASHLVPDRDLRSAPRSVGWSSRRSLVGRLGPDRAVPIAVAGILLGASIVSMTGGAAGASGDPSGIAVGGTSGAGEAPRIAIGGGAYTDPTGDVVFGPPANQSHVLFSGSSVDVTLADTRPGGQFDTVGVEGPFLDDGTLLKPVAVDTTVADGRDLLRDYTVKSGDTLTGIAKKFGVSMMTVWWANNLKSKDDLRAGRVLRIPPVNGLIVTVAATDTLDGLAGRFRVKPEDILATNGLEDPNLVVGQVLVVPGAAGKPIATPKPVQPARVAARTTTTTRTTTRTTTKRSSGSAKPPSSYTGGTFLWPVVGGNNYISQYFHYGHWAIDIAADYGSKVRAGGAGVVIFAGWKSNGGGYQVWIAHGSNLFTTYNHMSAITVGVGQRVDRGQQVGRVGQSGNATGPHLHFEVWRGPVWNGGTRLNPLGFL